MYTNNELCWFVSVVWHLMKLHFEFAMFFSQAPTPVRKSSRRQLNLNCTLAAPTEKMDMESPNSSVSDEPWKQIVQNAQTENLNYSAMINAEGGTDFL